MRYVFMAHESRIKVNPHFCVIFVLKSSRSFSFHFLFNALKLQHYRLTQKFTPKNGRVTCF